MKITKNLKEKLKKILIKDEIEAISVVNPTIFEKNISEFKNILEKNKLKYQIHSVLKVNHSNSLLKTALKNGLRADVSSIWELEQALNNWFSADKITSNWPKNKKFLNKSIEIWATIVVDSIQELEKLAKIAKEKNIIIKVIIRLWTFTSAKDTRFWIAKWLWPLSINILSENRDFFDLEWYHFHIDIPDVVTRIEVFWESLEYFKMMIKAWFNPKIIDIWWSFWTSYKNDINLWTDTKNINNRMYTNHEYWGKSFLEEFLTREWKWWKPSIASFLFENWITIWLEPGRSIFSNNVWFIATTVIWTREDSLILNTNSFWLWMREEEIPTNPILLNDENWEKKFNYWFLGNLCLESDIIYSRSISFSREVKEDDIIIFPNMAAYHMDFYETESISHPKKIPYTIVNDDLVLDK